MDEKGKLAFTVLFGIIGILAPFGAILVSVFGGSADLAAFNGMMLMFLSVLLNVFLIINCFHNFNTGNKKVFIIGIVLLLLCLISFIYHLVIFVNL